MSTGRVYQLQATLLDTVDDLLHVRALQPTTFQFIFQPNFQSIDNYLMAFDLDVVQLCFDGARVYGTWAAVQALTSGTFLAYSLRPEIEHLGRAAVRITKYIRRGFNFLYPRDFPIHRLLSLPLTICNRPISPYPSTSRRFGLNNDSLGIQKQFARFFLTE